MFNTNKIVVLIGGGPVARTIPNLIKGLPIVAVDGGLDTCISYSMVPNYFIGDMDSASSSAKQYAKLNKIPSNFVAEQETTDFEKALMYVDAAGYVCLGFLDPSNSCSTLSAKSAAPMRLRLLLPFPMSSGVCRNEQMMEDVVCMQIHVCMHKTMHVFVHA